MRLTQMVSEVHAHLSGYGMSLTLINLQSIINFWLPARPYPPQSYMRECLFWRGFKRAAKLAVSCQILALDDQK